MKTFVGSIVVTRSIRYEEDIETKRSEQTRGISKMWIGED